MKKKFLSVISAVLVIAVILSTFAGMTAHAYYYPPEITDIKATATTVRLDWYDQNGEVTGFYVYRSDTGKAKTWKKIAVTDAMYYTDKTVTPTKTYYYTVKSYYKADGITVVSESAPKWKVTTAVSKSSFSFFGNCGTGVLMKWDARKDISGVIIYRSRTGKAGSWEKIKTVKNNKAGSFTDTKVKIGETYYYCIKSYKTVNDKNYYSSSSKAYKKVISDVAVPQNFEVNARSDGMEITYNKVAGTKGYIIYRSFTGEAKTWKKIAVTTSNNTLSYVDTDVVNGVDYYYTVKSYKVLDGVTYASKPASAICETCKRGSLTINLSVNEIVFSELLEKQTVRIYVDGAPKYDTLKFEIADPTVAAAVWGNWNGNTIDLSVTRVGAGETTLRVYYDNYPDADVTIGITAEKLDLDDDYIQAKQYLSEAYECFSEALKAFSDSQKDGISEIEKANLIKKGTEKIKEASALLEKAYELAQKYGDYSNDDELIKSLMSFVEIINSFINEDTVNNAAISTIINSLNAILKKAGVI